MAHTLSASTAEHHRLLPDVADRMAKAAVPDVRKAESDDFRAEFGAVVDRVRQRAGLSLKQFADRIKRDERQIARWISGVERPQFDAIFAREEFRPLVVEAIAEIAGAGVQLETVVRVTRRIA